MDVFYQSRMCDLLRFMKDIQLHCLRRCFRHHGRLITMGGLIYCVNSFSEAFLLKMPDGIDNVSAHSLGMVIPLIFAVSYRNRSGSLMGMGEKMFLPLLALIAQFSPFAQREEIAQDGFLFTEYFSLFPDLLVANYIHGQFWI